MRKGFIVFWSLFLLLALSCYIAFETRAFYHIPAYVEYVLSKDEKLENMERKIALSLHTENNEMVSVLHEKKVQDGYYGDFNWMINDESFTSKYYKDTYSASLKSPMFEQYLVLDATEEKELITFPIGKDLVKQALSGGTVDVERENWKESRIIISKELSEDEISEWLKLPQTSMKGLIYEDWLKQESVIKETLTKEIGSERTVENIQGEIKKWLNDFNVTKATIQFTFKQQSLNELNLTILGTDASNQSWTIYLDISQWNRNKTKLPNIDITPTNSVRIENLPFQQSKVKEEDIKDEGEALKEEIQTIEEALPMESLPSIEELEEKKVKKQ